MDRFVVNHTVLSQTKKKLDGAKSQLEGLSSLGDGACLGSALVQRAYRKFVDKAGDFKNKCESKTKDYSDMIQSVLDTTNDADAQLASSLKVDKSS